MTVPVVLAWGQIVQFKIPIHMAGDFDPSTDSITLFIGVNSGKGTIPASTYAPDVDNLALESWEEGYAPPSPFGGWRFQATFYDIPSRGGIRARGDTAGPINKKSDGAGMAKLDGRGYTDVNQIDTFAIVLKGTEDNDHVVYSTITITWPNLSPYCSACTLLQSTNRGTAWFQVCNMFAANTYVDPATDKSERDFLIIKTGAKSQEPNDVENDGSSFPTTFNLRQNYPNPFNPQTRIDYSIKTASHVTLKVVNILGQVVATLVDEKQQAGPHFRVFDASKLSSGIYFYTIKTGDFSATKKMILMK